MKYALELQTVGYYRNLQMYLINLLLDLIIINRVTTFHLNQFNIDYQF